MAWIKYALFGFIATLIGLVGATFLSKINKAQAVNHIHFPAEAVPPATTGGGARDSISFLFK